MSLVLPRDFVHNNYAHYWRREMKRFIAICFVLTCVMALPADAALEMSVIGGYQQPGLPKTVGVMMNETVQIVISSDTELSYEAILSKDYGIGHIYPEAVLSPCTVSPIEDGISYLLTGGTAVPPEPGEHFVFNFVYDNFGAPMDSFVTLWGDYGTTVLDSYHFYDVPEPASALLMLLAAGAVTSRRKNAKGKL
jgi:hypothetical protein